MCSCLKDDRRYDLPMYPAVHYYGSLTGIIRDMRFNDTVNLQILYLTLPLFFIVWYNCMYACLYDSVLIIDIHINTCCV